MKAHLFSIVLTLIFIRSGFSQGLPSIIPPSPSSQAFQTFGDYPVDYSTGIPDISIPIYEINSGKLKLPIVLRYHVANVKPSFATNNIGIGWVLDTGGEISRTIYGAPDDEAPRLDDPTFFEGTTDFGPIDQTVWQNAEKLFKCISGEIDSEYDIFNYSFPGGSGKFIMTENATNSYDAHLLSYKPYQFNFILKQEIGLNPFLKTIQLTDDGGNKYTYGEGFTEESTSFTQHGDLEGISTWKLQQIKSSNLLDSISFSYVVKPEIFTNTYGYSASLRNDYRLYLLNDPRGYNIQYPITSPNSSDNFIDCQSSLNQIKYIERTIKKVEFNEGYLDFELSSDNRTIKGISVFNKNQLVKKIKFYQSNNNLDSLRVYDKNLTKYQTYRFDYHSGDIATEVNKVDYWGYYNGSSGYCANRTFNYLVYNSSQSLPALTPMSQTLFGGSNAPYPIKTEEQTLKTIHYPTGGETEFIYEPNRYESNINGELAYTSEDLSGGLRIRSVISRTNDGTEYVKRYKYGDNDVIDIRNRSDLFTNTHFNFVVVTDQLGGLNNGEIYSTRTRTFKNTLSAELIDNARYKKVVEILGSNESNSVGKNIYYYDYDSRYRSYYSSFWSMIQGYEGAVMPNRIMDFGKGDLYKKESLKKNPNGVFSKVLKEEYKFKIEIDPVKYKSLKVFQLLTVSSSRISSASGLSDQNEELNQVKFFFGGSSVPNAVSINGYNLIGHRLYEISTGKKKLEDQTITEYYNEEADSLITTTSYFYNEKNAISKIEKTINNEVLKTEMKYPTDFPSQTPYNTMVTKNIIAPIIEQSKYNGVELLSKTKTNYLDWGNNNLLPEYIQASKGTNTLEDRIVYHSYYSNGKIKEVSRADGPPISYVWGYNSEYPVAKIENATQSQIAGVNLNMTLINNSATSDTAMRSELDNLRTSLSGAMVTTYTYAPLIGVTSMTDPKGYTVYYEYDAFNRLKYVKDAEGHLVSENKYHYKDQF